MRFCQTLLEGWTSYWNTVIVWAFVWGNAVFSAWRRWIPVCLCDMDARMGEKEKVWGFLPFTSLCKVFSGYRDAIVAELSSYSRDRVIHKAENMYYLAFYRNLPTLFLHNQLQLFTRKSNINSIMLFNTYSTFCICPPNIFYSWLRKILDRVKLKFTQHIICLFSLFFILYSYV